MPKGASGHWGGRRTERRMRKAGRIVRYIFLICFMYGAFDYVYLRTALKSVRKQSRKLEQLLQTANQMLVENTEGRQIHKRLEGRNVSSVAIYGMSEIGERIMEDLLLHSSVRLLYGMDMRAGEIRAVIPVYTLEEAAKMEKPEVVILTTYTENDNLKKAIEEKLSCNVVTIGELFYE